MVEIIFFPSRKKSCLYSFDCINFLSFANYWIKSIGLDWTFEYWSMTVNYLVSKCKKNSLGKKENRDIYPGKESSRGARTTYNFVKIFFEIQKYISDETERTRFWAGARKLLRFHARGSIIKFSTFNKGSLRILNRVDFRLCFVHESRCIDTFFVHSCGVDFNHIETFFINIKPSLCSVRFVNDDDIPYFHWSAYICVNFNFLIKVLLYTTTRNSAFSFSLSFFSKSQESTEKDW